MVLKRKILYLNTSPWYEVENDYNNFVDSKGTINMVNYRLYINTIGDSSFL